MLSFKEFKTRVEENKLPLRERFFRGTIFKVGQIVEGTNHLGDSHIFEILQRGSNYVMTVNESGGISKWFIENLRLLEDAQIPTHDADGKFRFGRYVPSESFQSNEEAVAAFRETVQKYEEGKITDGIALAMAIKSVDIFLTSMDSAVIDRKDVHLEVVQAALNKAIAKLTQIGEYQHHQEYLHNIADTFVVSKSEQKPMDESMDIIKQSDKLKVASMIASAYGVDSTKNNAEVMVSAAIRAARKDPSWSKTKHVLQGMLEIARSVGIKFDEKQAEMADGWDYSRPKHDDGERDGSKFNTRHLMKNESEQLDELSIGTLTSFKDKAEASAKKLVAQGTKAKKPELSYAKFKKATSRLDAVHTAKKKIFNADWKERTGQTKNESEELSEASVVVKGTEHNPMTRHANGLFVQADKNDKEKHHIYATHRGAPRPEHIYTINKDGKGVASNSQGNPDSDKHYSGLVAKHKELLSNRTTNESEELEEGSKFGNVALAAVIALGGAMGVKHAENNSHSRPEPEVKTSIYVKPEHRGLANAAARLKHGYKKANESEELTEAQEQDHFKNAIEAIPAHRREIARKAYTKSRANGSTHAAALSSMHQMFSESEEIEEGIVDTAKSAVKSVKRGAQGWGIGASPEMIAPKGVVQGIKNSSDEKLIGLIKGGVYQFKGKQPKPHSPQELANRQIGRELSKRGLTNEELEEQYKPGLNVTIDHNGKPRGGKIRALHGSVIEVAYKNGKVGFHHSHKVSINEDQKADGPVDPAEYAELSARLANLGDESKAMSVEHTKPGHSFQYKNETHRHQLVHKLKGEQ